MKTKTILFGKLLLEKGIISQEQLETALAEQKNTGEFLGVTLVKLGFIFKTKSDTEVVLKAYEAWGPKCLDRFLLPVHRHQI